MGVPWRWGAEALHPDGLLPDAATQCQLHPAGPPVLQVSADGLTTLPAGRAAPASRSGRRRNGWSWWYRHKVKHPSDSIYALAQEYAAREKPAHTGRFCGRRRHPTGRTPAEPRDLPHRRSYRPSKSCVPKPTKSSCYPKGVTPLQSLHTPSAALKRRNMSGSSAWWLKEARRKGTGPAYLRIGRMIRYARDDLDAWLQAHRVQTRESRACTIRDTDINWELAPSPWPSSSTPADDQPTGDGSPTHSPSWRAARPTRSGESRSSNRSAMRIGQ